MQYVRLRRRTSDTYAFVVLESELYLVKLSFSVDMDNFGYQSSWRRLETGQPFNYFMKPNIFVLCAHWGHLFYIYFIHYTLLLPLLPLVNKLIQCLFNLI
jgi:hypothetical protein